MKFFEYVSEESKNNHEEDLGDVIVKAVGSDQAKKENQRKEDGIGHPENFHPEADQGKVENQEHDIPNVHARHDSPEEVRMFLDQHGAGLGAIDHQRPQEDRHGRRGGNAQGKQGNEGSPGRGVVRRLRGRNARDGSFAEFIRVLRDFLFHRVGDEGGDDGPAPRQNSQEKSDHRAAKNGPD